MLEPKRRFESVVTELVGGLKSGTVELSSEERRPDVELPTVGLSFPLGASLKPRQRRGQDQEGQQGLKV